MDDEQKAWKSIRRGQHLRACRKAGLFEHHGIAITESDLKRIEPSIWPKKIEPIVVAEQNVGGLRIVSIQQFCTDNLFKPVVYKLNIVQYSSTSEKLHLSRPGACRKRASVSEDEIIENVVAILNSPEQRAIWKSYSLCIRNCEQFAVLCCTSKPSLGCQIPICLEGIKCVFVTGTRAGVKAVYDLLMSTAKNAIRIGENLAPSTLSSGAVRSIEDVIKTSLQGNAIAAAVSFAIESMILTIRVLIYHFSTEEKREKYLACKWAITWSDYVKRMTQAGLANLAAFGFSVCGMLVGSAFLGVGAVPLSILFGFIGYIGTRWLTGIAYDKARDKLCGKGYGKMNQQMKKLSLKMARIRHESDIQRMRTDIRHLHVKAGSLQRQTSTVIEETRLAVCAGMDNHLMLKETVDFIQSDLEYLYTQLDELSGQHDLVSKQLEEMSFDDIDEHEMLSKMIEEASLSLFELRCRIEHLAENIQSALNLNPETEQNEIFETILDSCNRLSQITNDPVAE